MSHAAKEGISPGVSELSPEMEFSTPPPAVGLTGGIGAGKSTVARIFRAFGVPVFDADAVAKELYATSQDVRKAVAEAFGPGILTPIGVNRTVLAARIFSDDTALSTLNSIVHPAVAEAFELFAQRHAGRVPYVMREAAILFESGSDRGCVAVVCVVAEEEIRFARAAQRDGSSLEAIRARAARQMQDADRLTRCTYHILNNPGDALVPQVARIHDLLSAP
jgi:dephospho-CoA kinase